MWGGRGAAAGRCGAPRRLCSGRLDVFFLPDTELVNQRPLTWAPCAADLRVCCADGKTAVLVYGDHKVCSLDDSVAFQKFYDISYDTTLKIQTLTDDG